MATSKSSANPYKWADGSYHSISQAAHTSNMAAKSATAPAAAAPSTPAPVAPDKVNPFLTANDFDAINNFYTDLNSKLETIKSTVGVFDPTTKTWSGGSEEADTTYGKTQNDTNAKQGSSNAQDDAAARGIFQSSLKDATLYDIEAQRSLSNKFLDDKLSADRLTAGNQTQILANSKAAFDKDYGSVDAQGNPIWGTHAFENAQGVNDQNSAAWAGAQAAWAAANPQAAAGTTPAAAPAKGNPPPVAAKPAAPRPANQTYGGTGSTNSKPALATTKKTPKVVYGGR